MKVLIVGKNSYIGCHIGEYILRAEPNSEISYVSVRDNNWKQEDYSCYDAVVFAAAIVHRKDITDPELSDCVNALLPWEFAKIVREQGVKRFLFLSTAAVYGAKKTLPKGNVISAESPTRPADLYGTSKLKAEKLLQDLETDRFFVSIVRPMNVYGGNCPGNYMPMMKKIVRALPVLPRAFTEVKQGIVHVDNLAKLCYLALSANASGIYHAQDADPCSCFELMKALAQEMGKSKKELPCHGLMKLFTWNSLVVKLFGGVSYDSNLALCEHGDYSEVNAYSK